MEHQLTLTFETGLARKYRSLGECLTAVIHSRGLTRIAGELDVAPSNLSNMLGPDPKRRFGPDQLEALLAFGELEPLFYLIDKYAPEAEVYNRQQAANDLRRLIGQIEKRLDTLEALP